jgi:pilus assembly protein FimV
MPSKMHSKTSLKSGLFNLKILGAAVASALLFSNAYAAGLGKLTVLSSLGQPLRAEIELTSVSRDEAGTLVAKLASAEAFRQANIDYNAALMSLRFAVEQRGERQFIRVTSAQPLNEPFVDMLLELGSPNGRLIREYTFLLDPPDLRTTQSAQVALAPAPEAGASRAPQAVTPYPLPQQAAPAVRAPAPQAAAPRPVRPVLPAPSADIKGDAQAGEYKVKSGDSLGRIASQMKSGGVSLDQMLVALYRANPDAFIGNNMNRLRAGQILSVPSADTARSIGSAEAHSLVVAQSADFNNYRDKLAGRIATAAPEKSAESKQSATGKITAKIEEPATPGSESKDKLKLSKAGAGTSASAAAAAAEEKIARDKAIAEANARVKELEKNVGDLQKLLEVKNKNMAEQQKQADAAKTDAAPAIAPAPVPVPAPAAPAASSSPAVPPAASEKPVEANAEKAASAPANVPPVAAQVKPKPAAPAPEPSFIDELMDNPLVLPGVGTLLVALGALGVYSARRRKQQKQFEDSIITDSSLKANSLFGSTGGQSVDTNNSVFNSGFSPSANQLDTNEVDPVAEADVYIAYGRDAQAEEILKEALRTQPDRNAVRVKLLEIYSNRKDLRAFEVLATELYGLTKGEGEEWTQAAALGIAIDPHNPLYASGKPAKVTVAEGLLVAPTQPLDEQGLATLLSSTHSDTSSLETISDLGNDTSYFSNTTLATETPFDPMKESTLEPLPELDSEPEPEPASTKATSNELDFDLDGMGLDVPNTIPRPAPSELSPDVASIDFDFLEEPHVETETAATAVPEITDIPLIDEPGAPTEHTSSDATIEFAVDEHAPSGFDLPVIPEEPAVETGKADSTSTVDPLDFDLSGISLELQPEDAQPEPELVLDAHDFMSTDSDDNSAIDAEMATKLDLAVAYQEIGDKEGARELLDEVLKGGTPEQSERAKSLLMELA